MFMFMKMKINMNRERGLNGKGEERNAYRTGGGTEDDARTYMNKY